ncbi:MAG: phosphoribosylformylglycinamidine synthase subunit PurQ [Candidatus Cloacimonadales bacterium]
MKKIKALIITGFGINCEEELAAAYRLVQAESKIVHLNDIFLGRISIHEFDILNFPGGFSFGDDLGSGKVLANKMKYKQMASGKLFLDDLQDFIAAGKYILGICNGFQFLVKMGLLPNTSGELQQEVTLTKNDSGKYEDRWVWCKVNNCSSSPFLKNIDLIQLPVRHGEGKLIIRNSEQKAEILQHNLNCLSYTTAAGEPTDIYPLNPNGADLQCAALTDKTGQILGMMPHPEAYLSLYNHPNWGQKLRENPEISEAGAGLQIFQNIVDQISRKTEI